jgi:hypothetical protein
VTFCNGCGASVVENTTFCGKCGRQLKGEGVAGGSPQRNEMEPKHMPERALDPGAGARARREEARFEKCVLKAARRMSPVIAAMRPESRNRFGIYVNGDRVWLGPTYFIAKDAAEQVIKRLEDEGFEVIPHL